MRRILITTIAAGLAISPALAASPNVASAIKTFQGMSGDNAKMKTFCEMTKVMSQAGEKEDKAADAKIDTLLKSLGSDFEKAWAAGDDIAENSPDAKEYHGAMDDLMKKCGA
ncbi:MAG: hypothetical protein EKK41_26240 [Hyphomicrobiales bacterium]|nr:MAG: hypothetical protein EKK41_26240 [Hyphomicrobiales bacterium]